jgi:hypothetical protein
MHRQGGMHRRGHGRDWPRDSGLRTQSTAQPPGLVRKFYWNQPHSPTGRMSTAAFFFAAIAEWSGHNR